MKKLDDEQYEAKIQGNTKEFELYDSNNFIGLLPSADFVIDLEIDRAVSKVSSISKIYFNTFSAAEIVGNVKIGFSSELLSDLECTLSDCELSGFDLTYVINIGDEWVRGSANCAKNFCSLAEMDYLLRTSNTVNIFSSLNQTNILSPLYLCIYMEQLARVKNKRWT